MKICWKKTETPILTFFSYFFIEELYTYSDTWQYFTVCASCMATLGTVADDTFKKTHQLRTTDIKNIAISTNSSKKHFRNCSMCPSPQQNYGRWMLSREISSMSYYWLCNMELQYKLAWLLPMVVICVQQWGSPSPSLEKVANGRSWNVQKLRNLECIEYLVFLCFYLLNVFQLCLNQDIWTKAMQTIVCKIPYLKHLM